LSSNHASFIWSIADLLRGSFKAHQYGDIVLPFTVLRRLDAVLTPNKGKVLAVIGDAESKGIPVRSALLRARADHEYSFFNASKFDLRAVLGDPDNITANLLDYVSGFSENVRDIFDKYKISDRFHELEDAGLLFLVTQRFAEVDLTPDAVPNEEMGHIFEELIRKFAEASNETAGEHFTPRDVIELMVDLLLAPDADALTTPSAVRSIYDPTAGTGGMLSVAEDHIRQMNPTAKLTLAGQEINPQSYAICKADMTVKGQAVNSIVFGDTLLDDGHPFSTFNYCLSNPPFGVDWKKQQKAVSEEHKLRGFAGRFGPGLPRISDGSMLFLMHLVSKMRPSSGSGSGGRAGIILNGSPLFTGGAGSGESNIRRWILDRDYLEAIIALPSDMFYNTGITTYLWILTTSKASERVGKVQLVDGTGMYRKMRKGLGSKRNELSRDDIAKIVRLYGEVTESKVSKTLPREAFLYRTITIERPLRRSWAVTPERVARAMADKAIVQMAPDQTLAVEAALKEISGERTWVNQDAFSADLKAAIGTSHGISGLSVKALVNALGEQDNAGDICVDASGDPLPDSSLRETQNVPWGQDLDEYFEHEIRPFAADAWVDRAKTKEGAEIPFARYFYDHVPPRPLSEIDADLDVVLGRIRARLDRVKA